MRCRDIVSAKVIAMIAQLHNLLLLDLFRSDRLIEGSEGADLSEPISRVNILGLLSAIAVTIFCDFEEIADLFSHIWPLRRIDRLFEPSKVIAHEASLFFCLLTLCELGVH